MGRGGRHWSAKGGDRIPRRPDGATESRRRRRLDSGFSLRVCVRHACRWRARIACAALAATPRGTIPRSSAADATRRSSELGRDAPDSLRPVKEVLMLPASLLAIALPLLFAPTGDTGSPP